MTRLELSYRRNLLGLSATAVALAAFGALVTNSFYVTTAVFALIFAIAAIGLTLLFGFAGLTSLGQAAFVGIGAYTTALIVERLGGEPIVAMALAICLAACLGWAIARPLLRLSGNYLAMGSLAFGVIMYLAFSQFTSITGGLDPGLTVTREFSVGRWGFGDTRGMYWVAGVSVLLTLYVAINLLHSRVGRGLRALKTSEAAAECVGIPTVTYKSMVFAIAAGMAGLSGALYAFFMGSFNATAFGFPLSIELLIIVIVGSLRSVWGALFGAIVVTLLPVALDHFNDYKLFIYGAVMVLIMLFLPDGLFHGISSGVAGAWKRSRQS